MASAGRRTGFGLADLLFDRAFEFKFFQAVRLLNRMYPHRQPVGGDEIPSREVVHFHAHQSMEFPASQLRAIQSSEDGASPVNMTVAFMGLTGPLGVLPWHYTEWLLNLRFEKDTALEEFLDIFNHRMISHFYRAWEKHHFQIPYERTVNSSEQSPSNFTHYLFDLIGMGTAGLRGRLSISDQCLLRYAGLVAQRPHSASALRGILQDYFAVPVEITQFCGKWFRLESSALSRLGAEGINGQLGVGAVAGDAVFNQQAGFRIQIGPMSLSRFSAFLPNGKAFRALKDWVFFFIGRSADFELELVLAAADAPSLTLSDEGANPPRLGWTSWFPIEASGADLHDVVFTASEEATA